MASLEALWISTGFVKDLFTHAIDGTLVLVGNQGNSFSFGGNNSFYEASYIVVDMMKTNKFQKHCSCKKHEVGTNARA